MGTVQDKLQDESDEEIGNSGTLDPSVSIAAAVVLAVALTRELLTGNSSSIYQQ